MKVFSKKNLTWFKTFISIIAISLSGMISQAQAMVEPIDPYLPKAVELNIDQNVCPAPYSLNYCADKYDLLQCRDQQSVLYPRLKDSFLNAGTKPYCELPGFASQRES